MLNEKYQLKVNGEKPKSGMIYLASDGQIMVSIHNGRYCATTDGTGKVNLSEDIENCANKITDIPEECFTLKREELSKEYLIFGEPTLDYSEDWMNAEYNMLYYNKDLEQCPKKMDILIVPNEIGGEKVEGIASTTFAGEDINTGEKIMSIKKVIIPSSVKVIDEAAFYYTELENIILSNGLIYIGVGAFVINQLKNISLPQSLLYIDAIAFCDNQIVAAELPNNLKVVGDSAFETNQLTNIIIPDSVTSIGNNAFSYNQFPNADAITIEGDATRFDSNWTKIGFPKK